MREADVHRTEQSRRLRRDLTDAEGRLWYRLRARRLSGHKFVRQEPIGPFIVDFVCRERKVVIEVDGGQHAGSKRDAERDKRLAEQGYRTLRFWNNEVFGNIDGVLETIIAALAVDRPPHPNPLPASGERENQGRDV